MTARAVTLTEAERLALAADTGVALAMDEDAFRAFYDRTARALWVYLSRLSGDPQAADDLLQETYYRFLRARVSYEDEAHRRNYLFRVGTNLVRDGHRRRRTQPAPDIQHDDPVDPRSDVGGRVERRADLTRAMARLTPRERALVWLAYAEGKSHREIGDTIGVRAGSVKILLFRARRKMARWLGAAVDGPGSAS
jgi:RNA polymerase sigma-70 factor (ECF subfamily)